MTKKDNAFLIIGRFNPLTVYHCNIIDFAHTSRRIIAIISQQPDEKNPISIDTRVEMITNRYPSCDVVVGENAFDAIMKIQELNDAPTHVTVVHGSDRKYDANRYNKYSEQTQVHFLPSVIFDRNDAAHSATYVRAAARQGDYQIFKQACGFLEQDAIKAYDIIRSNGSTYCQTRPPLVEYPR